MRFRLLPFCLPVLVLLSLPLSAQSYQTNFSDVKIDRGHSPSVSHGKVNIDVATGAASLDIPMGPGIGARGAQYVPRLSGRWAPQIQASWAKNPVGQGALVLRSVGGFTLTPGYLDIGLITDAGFVANAVLPDGSSFSIGRKMVPQGGFPLVSDIETNLLPDFGYSGWTVGQEARREAQSPTTALPRGGTTGELVIALSDGGMHHFPSGFSNNVPCTNNPMYTPDCFLVVKGGVAYEFRYAMPLYTPEASEKNQDGTTAPSKNIFKAIRYRLERVRNRFGDEICFSYDPTPGQPFDNLPSAFTAEWIRGGTPLGIKVRVNLNLSTSPFSLTVTYLGGPTSLTFTGEGIAPVSPRPSLGDGGGLVRQHTTGDTAIEQSPLCAPLEFQMGKITSNPEAVSLAFHYTPLVSMGNGAGGGALDTVTGPGYCSTLSWNTYLYRLNDSTDSGDEWTGYHPAATWDYFQGVAKVDEQDTATLQTRTTQYLRTLPVPAYTNPLTLAWISTSFVVEVRHPDQSRTVHHYWEPLPRTSGSPKEGANLDDQMRMLAHLKHVVNTTEYYGAPIPQVSSDPENPLPPIVPDQPYKIVTYGGIGDLSVNTLMNGNTLLDKPEDKLKFSSQPYSCVTRSTDTETNIVETTTLGEWKDFAWFNKGRVVTGPSTLPAEHSFDRSVRTTYSFGPTERQHWLGPLATMEEHPGQPIPKKTMTYDTKGRLRTLKLNENALPSQTLELTYDKPDTPFDGVPTPTDAKLTGIDAAGNAFTSTRGAHYCYDDTSRNFLSSIQILGATYLIKQTSDEWGRPITRTDANGFVESFTWDAFGRLTNQKPTAPEIPTIVAYDSDGLGMVVTRGNQSSVLRFNAFGESIFESRTNGNAFSHRLTGRDVLGRACWQTGWRTGDGADEKTLWASLVAPGDYMQGASPGGWTQVCTQWKLVPATQERICVASKNVYIPPTVAGPVNKNSSYTFYDSRGRVIQTVDANHMVTNTTYTLGALGQSRIVTRGSGMPTRFETDALGRLRQVVNETENTPLLSEYTYDLADRILGANQWSVAAQDGSAWTGSGASQNRTWHYNPLGWLDQLVQPESGTTSYTDFMVDGKPQTTNYNNRVVSSTFDAQGRVLSMTSVDGTVAQSFTYDKDQYGNPQGSSNGKLITATSVASGTTVMRSMVYSGLNGRLSTLTRSVDGTSFVQKFAFDNYGRVNSRTYPDLKEQVTSFWDTMDLPKTTNFNGVGLVNLNYEDVTWNLSVMSYLGVFQTASTNFYYGEDQARLATIKHSILNKLSKTWSYGYDDQGRMLTDGEDYYTYDALGRLKTAAVQDPWNPNTLANGLFQSFSYDAFGNRTIGSTGNATNWASGPLPPSVTTSQTLRAGLDKVTANVNFSPTDPAFLKNRLPATAYLPNGSAVSTGVGVNGYDDQGNLLQVYTTPGDSTSQVNMTYDALARVTTLASIKAGTEDYSYDDEGLRIKVFERTTGKTRYNIYNEARQLIAQYEKLSGGTIDLLKPKKDILYVGTKEIAEVSSTSTSITLTDHVGTPRYIWAGGSSAVGVQKFLPFGESLDTSTGAKTAKGFTNHEQTDASGAIYMQARFYLPMWGRFASPDPARDQHFEATQSWNIYSYVQNNPTMAVDPTGMVAGPGGSPDPVNPTIVPEPFDSGSSVLAQTVEAVGAPGSTTTPGGTSTVAPQNMTVPGTLYNTPDEGGQAGIRQLADMRDNYGANVGGQEYVMANYSISVAGQTKYGFTPAVTDGAGKSATVPENLVPAGATYTTPTHNHPNSSAMHTKSDIPSTSDLRTTFTPGASGPRGSGYIWDATRGSAFKFTVRPGVDPYSITNKEPPRSAYIKENISW